MQQVDARAAFLRAADLAAAMIAAPAVAERWGEPSTSAGFTVGGVAGHTYLATRLVDRYLDHPEPIGGRLRRPGEYYEIARIDGPAQIEDDQHQTVRHDGEYVARRGPEAVAAKFAELVDRLARRLPEEPPDRLIATYMPGVSGRLDDFLANRTIELLVHADDLAESVGLGPLDLPGDAATVAITGLVEVARERLGDRTVLRALAGRDRRAVDGLRVL